MTRVAFLASLALLTVLLSGCNDALVRSDPVVTEPTPVSKLAHLNTELGVGYMREGRTDLAYKRLTKALDVAPDYDLALAAMALLLDQLGKTEDAEHYYKRAVSAGGSSHARNNYGTFLCRQGRIDAALGYFKEAVDNPLYNEAETALTNAGLCLKRNGRPAEAEEFLRAALARNGRVSSALIAMSELSLTNGRELAARGYLQRYLEVAKHSSNSLWLGVQIERELGDKNAVSSYAMALKANYPDAPETKLLLESEIQ